MKRAQFYLPIALLGLVLVATSCRTSRPEDRRVVVVHDRGHMPPGQAKKIYGDRSARRYAHGQREYRSYPLIIIRTPDIIIGRHPSGRYFYRNPAGYIYWQGYDNRFYLDDSYLGRVQYNNREYKEWKRRGRR